MEGYVENLDIDKGILIEIKNKVFYPTGDFGFYDNNKNLIYEGRRDQRIKINGNRFSLTTVYKAISEINCVSYSFVDTVEKNDNTIIIAAITLEKYEKIDESYKFIFRELKYKLSNFMLPKHIFLFKNLPYKPSQKIDEKSILDIIKKKLSLESKNHSTSFILV